MAAGALPHIGPVTVRGLPRWAQHPVHREPPVEALVRDATRMLEILATCRAPASPLDVCLKEANGRARATAVRQDPVHRERRAGPLRNGNPRGNPNLAPRCGAKTRLGCPCRSPAMANGRCRMHGRASTGPKTAAGKARIAAALVLRGNKEARVIEAHATATIRRGKVLAAAVDAGLNLESLAAPLRAVLGVPATKGDARLFVADTLLHRDLTWAETRLLVAEIRGMQKPIQRERRIPASPGWTSAPGPII